ncbi:MAG TPA: glycosyltransferase family 39 protein, partial [Thermoanaerobaculia bacterium]
MKELPRSRLVSALRTRFESRSLLAVLAVLAALWVASFFTAVRTDVKFTSQGGHLSLTVNERTIRGAETIPPVSRIQIQALNSIFPMGGRTIRVRQGGRVVFEDRLPSRFRVPRGAFRPVGDWYLDPYTGGGIVWERDVAFGGDFTLEATFTGRCSEYTSIILDSGGRRTQLQFRRGMINNDFLINVERQVIAVDALVSPLSRMALDAIDVLVRGGIAACLLILLFMGVSRLRRPDSVGAEAAEPTRAARPLRWTALAVAGIVLGALAIRLWVSRGILLGLAHTPDEVSYMLQGRWLLDNKLYQLASPIQEFLAVPFTYVREGKWFSMYPIGWPMLLVVGQAVGLPWVVSPVCGALYVLLLYLIGRDLYGKPVGLVAAVLGALSPMAILMFSSYLSHGAAALMIALFVWLFVVGRQRASPWVLALAGVSLGFAFGIRPVTAVAIAVPFGLLVLWELRRSSDRALSFRLLAALVGGGIIGSLPVFIANHLITGNALSFAYNYAQIQTYTRQGLPASLMFLDATFAYIPPTAFGWGWGVLPARVLVPLALAFVFVPFLVRRPRPIELAVGAMLVVLPVS